MKPAKNKKLVSRTLVFTLITSNINSIAFATGTEIVEDKRSIELVRTQGESVKEEGAGKIEVDINYKLPIKYAPSTETRMKVILTNKETGERREVELGSDNLQGENYELRGYGADRKTEMSVEGEDVSFYRLELGGVSKGVYVLEVEGEGYSNVRVELSIDKYSKRVVIGTSENKKEDQNINYPGAMLVGDVTGEGEVTEEDYRVLKEAIKKGEEKGIYDINRDGKVDITDLTYVNENKGELKEEVRVENTNPIIDAKEIKLEEKEGLEVKGEVSNLFEKTTESTVSFGSKEEVTEENPIEIGLSLGEEPVEMERVEIEIPNNENAPTEGVVIIEGKEYPFKEEGVGLYARESKKSIKVDLGEQVAVSQITIKVTGTRGNTNLTEIAKVEFVNNVYKEVPPPKMNIPVISYFTSKTLTGKEELVLGWEHEVNVDSYEIKLEKVNEKGEVLSTQKFKTAENRLTVPKVEAYATYRVSIQSLNGEWKSGYKDEQEGYDKTATGETNLTNASNDKDGKPDNVSEDYINKGWNAETGELSREGSMYGADSIVELQVVPESKPERTDKIKVEGINKGLKISWGTHSQAKEFDVYYRETGTKAWQKANDSKEPKYVDSNEENEIPDGVTNIDMEDISESDRGEKIRGNSITIGGLKDKTTYEVKVVATNHHGTGVLSDTYMGTTVALTAPEIPEYKLINTKKAVVKEGESPVKGIVDINYPKGGEVNTEDKFAIVDGDYNTHWTSNTWNIGEGSGKVDSEGQTNQYTAPLFTFDKEYEIGSIRIATRYDSGYDGDGVYDYVPITYWDSERNTWVKVRASFKQITDRNGVAHFEVILPEKIKTKKIQVALRTNPWYEPKSSISEIKFYEYDSIKDEIGSLFKDEFELELREGVSQEEIDELRERVGVADRVSGEYHPDKEELLKDLLRAEDLLKDKGLNEEVKEIDIEISKYWGGRNSIGEENDWQSLGVAVRPGDKITVYIGGNRTDTEFELGISQNYGESDTAIQTYNQKLKVGKNEIIIPKSAFNINAEKGGNLYIRLGNAKFGRNSEFRVRTSGAKEIPHLNINNKIGVEGKEEEVKEAIREYIRELRLYVEDLPKKYGGETNISENKYAYEERTAILNTTEIESERVMLTLPATQVLKGIEEGLEGDEEGQVKRLYEGILAWEQLVEVSYAQQGLLEKAIDVDGDGQITEEVKEELGGKSEKQYYEENKAPINRRINIKYQRMFPGAFMYASGHHIGVEYDTAKELVKGVPYKYNEEGEVINKEEGNLYGWGISHELGHVHDVAGLTYEETTNNILALITQTYDDEDKSRLEGSYDKVYERVTSQGEFTPQGLVGLGMFWQLHLAYDEDKTYEMLEKNTDGDIENDTFYAKLYREVRNKGLAEQEKGYDRTAQTIIMRASDAVKKDLREFFSRWGISASPKTNEYLDRQGYEEETRDIYYLNDEARRKRLEAKEETGSTEKLSIGEGVKVEGEFKEGQIEGGYINKKEVELELDVTGEEEKILGYEIIRKEITASGRYKETAVGFVERDKEKDKTSYTDIVDTGNNRVYEYKVVAYDYNLNKTEEKTIGTVKVKHDGSIAKSKFKFETNTRGVGDRVDETTGHGQLEGGEIEKVRDNNEETVYNGIKATDCEGHGHSGDAYITVDVGDTKSIVGLKYKAPREEQLEGGSKAIEEYVVYVSEDNKTWVKAHEGVFKEGENTIYFNENGSSENNQLWTHRARYVKIVSKGESSLAIGELEILAPPGDNVEIGLENGQGVYENGVGLLSKEYRNGEVVIPEGSLVVMGEYRGNPAYNVPLVLNENGENYAMESQIIMLADVPEDMPLDEVAKGTYIYWVTPEQMEKEITLEDGSVVQNIEGSEIKTVLYRYNKLENGSPVGQRLVSDSITYSIGTNLKDLPEIDLTASKLSKLRKLGGVHEVTEKLQEEMR